MGHFFFSFFLELIIFFKIFLTMNFKGLQMLCVTVGALLYGEGDVAWLCVDGWLSP